MEAVIDCAGIAIYSVTMERPLINVIALRLFIFILCPAIFFAYMKLLDRYPVAGISMLGAVVIALTWFGSVLHDFSLPPDCDVWCHDFYIAGSLVFVLVVLFVHPIAALISVVGAVLTSSVGMTSWITPVATLIGYGLYFVALMMMAFS